jgi:hypothetical protein
MIVDGLPFVWSTNLCDEEIREFYKRYSGHIQESDPPTEPGVIHIPLRFGFLEFLEGVCLWSASGDHHTVLYRSNKDWELWNARQGEIEELRQEQAAERGVQRQLLAVEDNHLAEKTERAIEAAKFDAAAALMFARTELRLKFTDWKEVPFLWSLWRSQFQIVFARFPDSGYGLEFLRKFDATPQAFRNFARSFASVRGFKGQECAEQTKRIYDEAMRMFPDHALLAADACLFWRRLGRYDLAMKICAEAIRRGFKDGTKSGFEGRMKRLERESKQRQTE